MSWERIGVIAGVIGTVVALVGLVQAVTSGWKPTLFSGANDRFSCQLRSYPSEPDQLWRD